MKRSKTAVLLIAVVIALLTACSIISTDIHIKPASEQESGVLQEPGTAPEAGVSPGAAAEEAVSPGAAAAEASAEETAAVPVSGGNTGDSTGESAGRQKYDFTGIREINGLVSLRDLDAGFVIDMRYAGENNFTGKKVYPSDQCLLRKETAEKLVRANAEFMEAGYRLKIWDAYRPMHVQQIFWELVGDSRYVANPKAGGSNHNRGAAVDVTLVDKEGKELRMPSGFDDFSPKAARNQSGMDPEAKENMDLLTKIMVKNGFKTIGTEWWHFDDTASSEYEVLDVKLEAFEAGGRQEPREDAPEPEKEALRFEDVGDAGQVLLVTAQPSNQAKAKIQAFEKTGDTWSEALGDIPAMIGAKGLTSDKREGDKKSPQGVFTLGPCYGREANPGTRMPFTVFPEDSYWVDDVDSPLYNTYQTGPVDNRWKSAEELYKVGYPYKYFVVINYNTREREKGRGSAIFLHIWLGEDIPTSGCTAVSEENLLKIIKWLDPAKNPVIVQRK